MPDADAAGGSDPRARTDRLRARHGVLSAGEGRWVLLRHDLVVQAALDPGRFSSAVSSHLQVPNGFDGADHARWRAVIDPFLGAEALAPFHDRFRRVAAGLVASLPRGPAVDAVSELGARFAVRAQTAWLGWPPALEDRLVAWVAENHAATRSGDRERTRQVAQAFDDLIRSILAPIRAGDPAVDAGSVTARLTRTAVMGRPLSDAELVSILRNWTGGDLGSMALCIGVLVHRLAVHPALQDRLRAGLPDAAFDAVIDEVLRIDDPFVSNRRVTTCPVTIGGVGLPAGARVDLHWTSANRDDAVFGDPDAWDPDGHAAGNLVYGIGRHACPGRLLATLQMRIVLRSLLAATSSIALDLRQPAERSAAPVGGWARVPVVLGPGPDA